MLFTTVRFAVFFMTVWIVATLASRSARAWKLVLLAASLVFYAAWDWRALWMLVASFAGTQLFAIAIARRPRLLWLGVAAELAVLGWFKYEGFFARSMSDLLGALGVDASLPVLDVVLPLGLSFLTFKAIAYLVEVRRGTVAPAPWLDAAVWYMFFPTLTAGPIVRPSELLPQLAEAQRDVDASRAFWLIARGLFKKIVIASYLATALADATFDSTGELSSLEILLGIYAYALQIYVDFSGYTDIAIGVALLLGVRLPENFDRPYTAASIQEFWTRWHITLSRWLRDFLFAPLVRGRGRAAAYPALITVMVLAGLWHGAGWTFVLFGAVHGVALAIERALHVRRRRLGRHGRAPALVRRVVAFHVVCLGWVFFRAESVAGAFDVLRQLFTAWGPAPAITPLLVLTLVAVIGAQYIPERAAERVRDAFARTPAIVQAGGLAASLFLTDVLGPAGVPPFIYYRF